MQNLNQIFNLCDFYEIKEFWIHSTWENPSFIPFSNHMYYQKHKYDIKEVQKIQLHKDEPPCSSKNVITQNEQILNPLTLWFTKSFDIFHEHHY
jgi:hypothetical protein